jgi:hypothetical protein
MRSLLATIEHSGTRFTMSLFDMKPRIVELDKRTEDSHFLYTHLTDEMMPLIREAAKEMPLITTYRDPDLIRASWERRGKDLRELARQLENYQELLTFKPSVIYLWGGFHRLPPPYAWFKNLPPHEIDQQLLKRPRFSM